MTPAKLAPPAPTALDIQLQLLQLLFNICFAGLQHGKDPSANWVSGHTVFVSLDTQYLRETPFALLCD